MKRGWVNLRAPQYNPTLKTWIPLKQEGFSILIILLLSGAVMEQGKVHTFYILWLYASSVGRGLLTIDTDPFIKALFTFQSAEVKNQVVYTHTQFMYCPGLEEIQPPSLLVILKYMGNIYGVNISHQWAMDRKVALLCWVTWQRVIILLIQEMSLVNLLSAGESQSKENFWK